MTRSRRRLATAALGLGAMAAIPLAACPAASARDGWSVAAYGGAWVADGAPWEAGLFDFEDAQLALLTIGKDLFRVGDHLRIEAEGQVGKHFGEQDHFEVNAALLARWLTFPWDRHIDTSAAVGSGLSYATETPALEERLNTDDGTQRLLNYLVFELELSLPSEPSWSAVLRLHHRSGVFGLFGGARGASDFLLAGVRCRF
ncbi:MAG TPA: hypothetical protein VFO41_17970 [Alphaproteobacteria bacterium]|nr:hypothetical protein [Alphaproteobacteria bacterium]